MKTFNIASKLMVAALGVAVWSSAVFAQAGIYPAPEGPPTSTNHSANITVDGLTTLIQAGIDAAVTTENASLAKNSQVHATISASLQQQDPVMMYTTNADQPNQYYAEAAYIATYQVNNMSAKLPVVGWVTYPWSRTIVQYFEADTTCNGWATGNGSLVYTITSSPAYLDNNLSVSEALLNSLLLETIPNYINGEIDSALQKIVSQTATLAPGTPCRSLGLSTKAQGFSDNFIDFDPPAVSRPFPIPPVPQNQITVTVTQVERLPLVGTGGAPIYNVVENPVIDFYVEETHLRLQLPQMTDGQIYVPTEENSATIPIPATSLLVLIADMTFQNPQTEATNFVTFGSGVDYGAGTRTIEIYKQWIEPPPMPGDKPAPASAPGYQITFQITAPPVQGGNL